MKRIDVVELYVKKRIEKLEQTQPKAKCVNAVEITEVKPQYKETACDHVYGR